MQVFDVAAQLRVRKCTELAKRDPRTRASAVRAGVGQGTPARCCAPRRHFVNPFILLLAEGELDFPLLIFVHKNTQFCLFPRYI